MNYALMALSVRQERDRLIEQARDEARHKIREGMAARDREIRRLRETGASFDVIAASVDCSLGRVATVLDPARDLAYRKQRSQRNGR
ncbi:MAG: hypothetical protein ACLPTJ_11885 [Solirubrobacteraceae bacterium]